MQAGTQGSYPVTEDHFIWLAESHRVTYAHPGVFQAGMGHVWIESGRRGDFLAGLTSAMGADQEGAAKDPYSRFKEYDALARAVYLGHCRAVGRAKLFEIFRLRVVNAGEPGYAERYRYPVRRGLKALQLPRGC